VDVASPRVSAGRDRRGPRLTLDELIRLFEGTADGVYIVDAEQRIVAWTAAAEKLLGRRADEVLDRRCYEVIAGRSVREIAADLVVSSTTVRNHVQNLIGKLGVHSRLQAILYAARRDLL
jgi:DNA-binding NarL/FixJ family response regulator